MVDPLVDYLLFIEVIIDSLFFHIWAHILLRVGLLFNSFPRVAGELLLAWFNMFKHSCSDELP